MSLLLERDIRFRRNGLSQWWAAIDKPIFVAMMFLGACGIVLAFSTSPSIAARTAGLEPFYFAERQIRFAIVALLLCLSISAFTLREVRRLGVLLFGLVLLLLIAVLIIGETRNGAQRWLSVFGFSIQPSELAKPALIAITAWMFSLRLARGYIAPSIALLSGALTVLLVARQPDYSQAAVIALTWGAIFFLTGASIVWAVSAAILAIAAGAIAYAASPYVADRVQILFDTGASGGGEQLATAVNAIREGGLTGIGPGEGIHKALLPDAHSDFGIAVMAEEFGLIGAGLILIAYMVVIVRSFLAAIRVRDAFAKLALGGIGSLIALQTAVHFGVSVRLVPPTGMTLPLISYGGSSLIAMGIVFGMLLAMTRRDQDYMP